MINDKNVGGMLERMKNHPQVKLGDEIREALKNIIDIVSVNYDVDYINNVKDLYIDIKIYLSIEYKVVEKINEIMKKYQFNLEKIISDRDINFNILILIYKRDYETLKELFLNYYKNNIK